jgi:hypothetical protein
VHRTGLAARGAQLHARARGEEGGEKKESYHDQAEERASRHKISPFLKFGDLFLFAFSTSPLFFFNLSLSL